MSKALKKKKAEHQRIDTFELWCWRRLLRVPWTARRSNQTILKEINPKYSLVGLMLKLKAQYLATWYEKLTHWKRLWFGERFKGGEEDDRGWDGWMASLTWWAWIWEAPGVGDGQGSLVCCSPWGHKESDTTEQLNWIELNFNLSNVRKLARNEEMKLGVWYKLQEPPL